MAEANGSDGGGSLGGKGKSFTQIVDGKGEGIVGAFFATEQTDALAGLLHLLCWFLRDASKIAVIQ